MAKNVNAAVAALVNAVPPNYSTWDFYSFASVNGPVVNLTTGDFDALGPPPANFATAATSGFTTTYHCGSYGSGYPKIDLKQSKVQGHWTNKLDSDQWQVFITPATQDAFSGSFTYPDVIGGTPWLAACRAGLFDGASVLVARAFYATPPAPPYSAAARTCVGTALIFSGFVGTVDCSQTVSVFTINDGKYLLQTQMPRNVLQASCRHTLFDSRCTLSASSFVKSASAQAGSTRQNVIATPSAPGGSGTWTLGRMVGTSGANNTFQRTITSWDGVKNFQPQTPWPFAPGAGDTFNFYPGCDKSTGNGGCGSGGFNNIANFGGQPYIPVPDIQIG